MTYRPGAAASRMLAPSYYVAGQHYLATSGQNTGTNNTLTVGSLRVGAWVVTRRLTVAYFFAEYTAAGDSGALFRIGVWASDGTGGQPNTLIKDAGTIAVDGTPGQVATADPSLTLDPGLYWIGGAVQNTTGQPTMRVMGDLVGPGGPFGTSIPGAAVIGGGFLKTSQTGAFGAFSSPSVSSVYVRVGFKAG